MPAPQKHCSEDKKLLYAQGVNSNGKNADGIDKTEKMVTMIKVKDKGAGQVPVR